MLSLVKEEVDKINFSKLRGWKGGLIVGTAVLVGARIATSAWHVMFGDRMGGFDILPPGQTGYGRLDGMQHFAPLTVAGRSSFTDFGSHIDLNRASHHKVNRAHTDLSTAQGFYGFVQGLHENAQGHMLG